MRLLIVALAFWLAGCAHTSAPAYHEVKVATPVSCVPRNAAEAPQGLGAPDTLAALPDGPERYVRLSAAYLALWGWSLTAIPVIEGCRSAAPAP